jgi:alpha-beta hydrolase superfamily lysophospholipase
MRAGVVAGLALGLVLALAPRVSAAGRPVSFAAPDGVVIAGAVYDAPGRPAPAVVLVHMLGRTRADWDGWADQLTSAGMTVLAIDLRGHGASGGSAGTLADMTQDVRAAVAWLAAQPTVRPDAIGVVGASLGANLALLATADTPLVRVVAVVSPSLDYRGLRIGQDVMRRIGDRPVWMAASTEDPFALRTLKELANEAVVTHEQQLSVEVAHGTALLGADASLAQSLVDWLRNRLVF